MKRQSIWQVRSAVRLGLCVVLLLAGLTPAARAFAAEAGTPGDSVLVLYDSLAKGTADEGSLPRLERLLASFGQSVEAVGFDRYEPGTLAQHPRLVVLRNRPDLALPAGLLAELTDYRGDRFLETGSAYAERDNRAADPLDEWAAGGSRIDAPPAGTEGVLPLGEALGAWLGKQPSGKVYLVFKEVYPFSDLDLLRAFSGRLQEAGLPFALATRPVFSNTDYPAMLRYLEALKQAQSDGASLLVQTPVVKLAATRSDASLRAKMNGFLEVLIDSGLAPLGIVSEAYWSFDGVYSADGLGFFDSAVLLPDENPLYQDRMARSARFASSPYAFLPGEYPLEEQAPAAPPTDLALVYDLPETEEDMNSLLDKLRSSWLSFADYKDAAHTVRTAKHTSASEGGRLVIDGRTLSTDYVPKTVSGGFEYTRRDPVSFAKLFRAQNRFFLYIISAALVVFALFIAVGRRLNKKKFLK
ncbi:hypothetical protein [Gorillibacterium sp. sgz500922]|uniref:hypothetical protein n=1 Tax=Gorillibacterium sp. sgz500922 TaxID=3446694 RepID=UPI003F6720BA